DGSAQAGRQNHADQRRRHAVTPLPAAWPAASVGCDRRDDDIASGAAGVAVFIQVNTLIGAQVEAAVGDRHGHIHAGNDAANVTGHVVVAFFIVAKHGVAVDDVFSEPALDIVTHVDVDVFANHQ